MPMYTKVQCSIPSLGGSKTVYQRLKTINLRTVILIM